MKTLLRSQNLRVHFPVGRGWFRRPAFIKAVDGVDLSVSRGETLAIVGESGSGKSTLGRALLRLGPVSSGTLHWENSDTLSVDLLALDAKALRAFRRKAQMVFQDPYASLNPRHSAGTLLAEPLRIHALAEGVKVRDRVVALLEAVGLNASDAAKYPHQFSGGQRQRLAIARALAVEPELVVADEPISALDMSVQAQILGLMEELKRKLGLTYVFISHDLGVVRRIANRVLVLYLGHVVEEGDGETLFQKPRHPYTQALMAASLVGFGKPSESAPLTGEIPSPLHPPPGCPFQTRCPNAKAICRSEYPPWVGQRENRVACWLYVEN